MHNSQIRSMHRLVGLLVIGLTIATGAAVAAPAGLAVNTGLAMRNGRSVTIPVGRSTTLHFERMRRVEVIEPDLVEVVVASLNDLSLYGKKAGETTVFVWDKAGMSQIEVTVVAPSPADKLVENLRRVLGNKLTYTPAGDMAVVIEGTVSAEEAERARSIIAVASKEGLQIVDLIRVQGDSTTAAVAVANALRGVLGDKLQYTIWNNNTLIVQGQVGDQAALDRARRLVTAVTGRGVNVVDLLEYQESAGEPPLEDIARAVGDKFRVWQVQGKTVAIEGEVASAAELANLSKLLEAFAQQARIINMVRVVEPQPDINAAMAALQEITGNRFSLRPFNHEAIIIEGMVQNADEMNRVRDIIAKSPIPFRVVDLLRVALPEKMQIVVHAKVLEISKGDSKKLGVNWGQLEYDGETVGFVDQPWLVVAEGGVNNVLTLGAQVEALKLENKARILAEPNVMVDDGDPAEILVGGEIPIPIAQAGGGGVAEVTVEWKDYGVHLAISPTILENRQRINLKVVSEVSSLDASNAVTISSFSLPALKSRRVKTTVTIGNNDTLILGGLLQSEDAKIVSKIPLIGDLPVIGQLFRHKQFQHNETELVIMVTPEIMDKSSGKATPVGGKMTGITAAPVGGSSTGVAATTK
ncbi:MAG: pilus assembly protein N-terminal domain-containing protein [Armatimonadia bacterium]